MIAAEAKYSVNFTESGKRFALSLHYNVSNSFLFVNATKLYKFKAKHPLGHISKDVTVNTIKKKQD